MIKFLYYLGLTNLEYSEFKKYINLKKNLKVNNIISPKLSINAIIQAFFMTIILFFKSKLYKFLYYKKITKHIIIGVIVTVTSGIILFVINISFDKPHMIMAPNPNANPTAYNTTDSDNNTSFNLTLNLYARITNTTEDYTALHVDTTWANIPSGHNIYYFVGNNDLNKYYIAKILDDNQNLTDYATLLDDETSASQSIILIDSITNEFNNNSIYVSITTGFFDANSSYDKSYIEEYSWKTFLFEKIAKW